MKQEERKEKYLLLKPFWVWVQLTCSQNNPKMIITVRIKHPPFTECFLYSMHHVQISILCNSPQSLVRLYVSVNRGLVDYGYKPPQNLSFRGKMIISYSYYTFITVQQRAILIITQGPRLMEALSQQPTIIERLKEWNKLTFKAFIWKFNTWLSSHFTGQSKSHGQRCREVQFYHVSKRWKAGNI